MARRYRVYGAGGAVKAAGGGSAGPAVRPPKPLKIRGARRLRGEPRVELLNRPRVIHSADGVMAILAHHYILCLRERNG